MKFLSALKFHLLARYRYTVVLLSFFCQNKSLAFGCWSLLSEPNVWMQASLLFFTSSCNNLSSSNTLRQRSLCCWSANISYMWSNVSASSAVETCICTFTSKYVCFEFGLHYQCHFLFVLAFPDGLLGILTMKWQSGNCNGWRCMWLHNYQTLIVTLTLFMLLNSVQWYASNKTISMSRAYSEIFTCSICFQPLQCQLQWSVSISIALYRWNP